MAAFDHSRYVITRDKIEQTGEEIGRGQFGSVRKGKYEGTDIAIKFISSATDQVKLLAKKEFELMFNLKHKHVLRGLALISEEDPWQSCFAIILPYMENGDLKQWISAHDYSVKDALRFSLMIARGMNFLVARGIIHGDLAARNCMLDGSLSIRVADFGLAHLGDEEYYTVDINDDRYRPGLPIRWYPIDFLSNYYSDLANEEADPAKVAKPSLVLSTSDVWSFGILLGELFTKGQTPYPDLKSTLQIFQFLQKNLRPGKPDSCPDPVYELMIRSWLKTHRRRPSFDDVIHYLTLLKTGKFEVDLEALIEINRNKESVELSDPDVMDAAEASNESVGNNRFQGLYPETDAELYYGAEGDRFTFVVGLDDAVSTSPSPPLQRRISNADSDVSFGDSVLAATYQGSLRRSLASTLTSQYSSPRDNHVTLGRLPPQNDSVRRQPSTDRADHDRVDSPVLLFNTAVTSKPESASLLLTKSKVTTDKLITAMKVTAKIVFIGFSDGSFSRYRITETEKLLFSRTTKAHTNLVSCISTFATEAVVTASWDTEIKFWDFWSGELLSTIKNNRKKVQCMSIFGMTLVSCSRQDREVMVWQLNDNFSGTNTRVLHGHTDYIRDVALHGNTVVSASDDASIKVWDTTVDKPVNTLRGHNGWVLSLQYDGCTIVSGGQDRTVRIWQESCSTCLQVFMVDSPVWSLSLSEGKILAGDQSGWVYFWRDPNMSRKPVKHRAHEFTVKGVSFSADVMVSSSHDKSVCLMTYLE